MSEKMDYAVKLFRLGFNCSQSVLASFCEKYGLEQKEALKLACGFGGGMRNAEVCGAVSGAILVIGLKYGQYKEDDLDSKNRCYKKTVEFTNIFREQKDSLICKELLAVDISTAEGMVKAKESGLFSTTCVDMIQSAVYILENLGY